MLYIYNIYYTVQINNMTKANFWLKFEQIFDTKDTKCCYITAPIRVAISSKPECCCCSCWILADGS